MDHRKRGRAPVVLARDRMSNDGEQQQVKQVSGRASGTRAGMLLPSARAPAIVSARRGAHRLDALLAIVPPRATAASFRELPESGRWRELNARAPARAGTVRSTSLSNPRQTLAVLGFLADEASAFERLTLAGRMLKEAAARNPPAIQLLGGEHLDTRHAAISARGTNLARWLTALPPNMLDASGYRQVITYLARAHGLTLRWLDERRLRRLGANAFLAVAAGNAQRTA